MTNSRRPGRAPERLPSAPPSAAHPTLRCTRLGLTPAKQTVCSLVAGCLCPGPKPDIRQGQGAATAPSPWAGFTKGVLGW